MMKINKPSIKGDADLENSIAITCDIVIIVLFFNKKILKSVHKYLIICNIYF